MKESMWGYLIIALGVVIIAILVFVQRLTTTNEQDYHLSREIMKSAMLDAVDYGTYMKTGKLVMSKEKFVAVFTRRFAESVTPDRTYTLNFYDIHEYPPKATVRINTTTGETSINGNAIDLDLNTFISAILVTSEAEGIINIQFDSSKGDLNSDGSMNPLDLRIAVNCFISSCSQADMIKSIGGNTNAVDLDDISILEQAIMGKRSLGDVNKDGSVNSEDVSSLEKKLSLLSSSNLKSAFNDPFQLVAADVNGDGVINSTDLTALSNLVSTGKLTISRGDINGDGMVSASDALLVRDYLDTTVYLNDSQIKLADYDNNSSVNQTDVNKIVRYYANYLNKLFEEYE